VHGDLDDALDRHDGHCAHVVYHCHNGARVLVPLRVLTNDQSQAISKNLSRER
jgi:hypothetical protein